MQKLIQAFLFALCLLPQIAWANNDPETKNLVAKIEALFTSNGD